MIRSQPLLPSGKLAEMRKFIADGGRPSLF